MSGADSDDDRLDALTERYRIASAADPAHPSDAVRQSILAHARTVAAGETRLVSMARTHRRAANESTWRIATAASVMVAGLAALLAWHGRAPAPSRVQETKAVASDSAQSAAVPQPFEPLPQDRAPTAPAPSAVTSRSRARTSASPQPPRASPDAATHLETDSASVASLQRAPARLAAGTTATNAAAAAPGVEARQSQTRSADAAARMREAPGSPLVAAAGSGDLGRLDQLLRSGMSTEETDLRGRTALLLATLRGDVPMVQRLLEAGARTDAADEDGDTPLAAAQRQGSAEIVRLLQRPAVRP